jgi:hypothetical protein
VKAAIRPCPWHSAAFDAKQTVRLDKVLSKDVSDEIESNTFGTYLVFNKKQVNACLLDKPLRFSDALLHLY